MKLETKVDFKNIDEIFEGNKAVSNLLKSVAPRIVKQLCGVASEEETVESLTRKLRQLDEFIEEAPQQYFGKFLKFQIHS